MERKPLLDIVGLVLQDRAERKRRFGRQGTFSQVYRWKVTMPAPQGHQPAPHHSRRPCDTDFGRETPAARRTVATRGVARAERAARCPGTALQTKRRPRFRFT